MKALSKQFSLRNILYPNDGIEFLFGCIFRHKKDTSNQMLGVSNKWVKVQSIFSLIV